MYLNGCAVGPVATTTVTGSPTRAWVCCGIAYSVSGARLTGGIATCTTVLKELMLRTYDVLHFAGHCKYDKNNPSASGWIFSMQDKLILSAAELNRLDRVPQFVFSNACESGVLPDRAELRSADLAPSFAEAFFERGVANFVCTAWPVNDLAARVFAVTMYESLLGMDGTPQPMHKALQKARLAIHRTDGGKRSWGAYQHYGNPFFKLVK